MPQKTRNSRSLAYFSLMTPSHHLTYDALASFIQYSVPDMPPLSQDLFIGASSNISAPFTSR